MRLGIDMDGVLADSHTAMINYHNAVYGTCLKIEDFTTLKFHEVWGGTGQEAIDKVNDFQHSPYFLEIIPILDSVESAHALSKQNELFVITSRLDYLKEETERWLDKFFKGIFVDVHYTSNHYTNIKGSGTKPEICKKLGISLLIDDSYDYIQQCLSAGVKGILFGDYGWNRETDLPLEIRCKNWKEVLEKLNEH
jgi:uncharacterized HAD superfamily protein